MAPPRKDPGVSLNDRIAQKVTAAVGTMWTAYLFTALALVSLPAVIATRDPVLLVSWLSSSFLQLVLLPVVMVGQRQVKGALAEEHHRTHRFRAALREHHGIPHPEDSP
ncbi:MAG: hypothetical protein NVSMB4_03230 [Acidimicrobiales bacterium]